MNATRTYVRVQFDAPTSRLDVKVYGPDGVLLRVIPGATLQARPPVSPAKQSIRIAPTEAHPAWAARKSKRWSAT